MKGTIAISLGVLLLVASVGAQPMGHGRGHGVCGGQQGPGFDCRHPHGMGGHGRGHGVCGAGGRHGGKHPRGMGSDHDGFPRVGAILRHADEIDLTAEQKEQLEKLMLDHKLTAIDMKAAVKKAQVQVKALMRDQDASEQQVMRAIEMAAKTKAEMAKMKYRYLKEFRNIVSEEQLEKLHQKRSEWLKQRRETNQDEPGPSFRGRRRGR